MVQMMTPRSDHPIRCSTPRSRVRAMFQGHTLADSDRTLVLSEAGHPDRIYFPREDIDMAVLVRNDHQTLCPYKGQASYFTINRDARVIENIGWSYETPNPAMSDIAGMISFYPEFVDIEMEAADVAPPRDEPAIAEYIRHTDSGSGRSQEAPWPATVRSPDDDDEVTRPLVGGRFESP